jgi:integrase
MAAPVILRDLWLVAVRAAGIGELHLHDLRHTGNTMAAATGASLRELMERMRRSSSRAALIYQHASRDRDEVIAAAMGTALTTAMRRARRSSSGTQRARGRGTPS